MILYALLCGSLPFDDENIPNLFRKIKAGMYSLPSHLSPGAGLWLMEQGFWCRQACALLQHRRDWALTITMLHETRH